MYDCRLQSLRSETGSGRTICQRLCQSEPLRTSWKAQDVECKSVLRTALHVYWWSFDQVLLATCSLKSMRSGQQEAETSSEWGNARACNVNVMATFDASPAARMPSKEDCGCHLTRWLDCGNEGLVSQPALRPCSLALRIGRLHCPRRRVQP